MHVHTRITTVLPVVSARRRVVPLDAYPDNACLPVWPSLFLTPPIRSRVTDRFIPRSYNRPQRLCHICRDRSCDHIGGNAHQYADDALNGPITSRGRIRRKGERKREAFESGERTSTCTGWSSHPARLLRPTASRLVFVFAYIYFVRRPIRHVFP